jgi:hypothetical protein
MGRSSPGRAPHRTQPAVHPATSHASPSSPRSYAEYETKLEQLRQARRRALCLAQTKQTLADYALVKRVHFIFERATRKFKRDLSIWTRWLEFCRATRSNRRLSRVAARALQLHSNAPGLWAYAAAWEFEENASPAAARALMQQGLRMCKDSRQMWLQYLEMVRGLGPGLGRGCGAGAGARPRAGVFGRCRQTGDPAASKLGPGF